MYHVGAVGFTVLAAIAVTIGMGKAKMPRQYASGWSESTIFHDKGLKTEYESLFSRALSPAEVLVFS